MEMLMQHIWQHKIWDGAPRLRTVDGRVVEVVDQGLLNGGPGPDFFNAKIRLDDKVWAGNVEVHVRASDWHAHSHDGDTAYDNVVLHVVSEDDCRIRIGERELPQAVLPISAEVIARYEDMCRPRAADVYPCRERLADIPKLCIDDWITALGYERLQSKADSVLEILERNHGDWLETAYQFLARALGFGANGEAMERTARSVPLRILFKHSGTPLSALSLLLGQAGLLPSADDAADDMAERMTRDYEFLKAKFALTPPADIRWRTGGIRPANAPSRRIATLAAMVGDGFDIAGSIWNAPTASSAADILCQATPMHPYFGTHHRVSARSARPVGTSLSAKAAEVLIINFVAPLIYARGYIADDGETMNRAVEMLQSLPPEDTSEVRAFAAMGLPCDDAFVTQAIHRLKTAYCDTRKCIYCRWGHRLLSRQSPAGAAAPQP